MGTLDLIATSSPIKLSKREADLAVRITRKPPDNYIGREVCKFRHGIYLRRLAIWTIINDCLLTNIFGYCPTAVLRIFTASQLPVKNIARRGKSCLYARNNTMSGRYDSREKGSRGVTSLSPAILGDREAALILA